MKGKLWMVLAALLVAGCQAHGPADNRLGFRFQWLSYLQGDDMVATCRKGGPDRLRLIYNANFNLETRTYDFFFSDNGSAVLDSRRWVTADSVVVVGGSLNTAIAPQKAQTTVPAERMVELTGQLAASGFPGPVPVGEVLRSDSYFWVGLACIDGVFGIQVWSGSRLGNAGFVGLLQSLDPIRAPLPPAQTKQLPPFASVVASNRRNGDASSLFYQAEVGAASIRAWWRT